MILNSMHIAVAAATNSVQETSRDTIKCKPKLTPAAVRVHAGASLQPPEIADVTKTIGQQSAVEAGSIPNAIARLCPVAPTTPSPLRVLYLFSGRNRKASIKQLLTSKMNTAQAKLVFREMDAAEDPTMDLFNDENWATTSQCIENGLWDILILSPLCDTHSRARGSNRQGPRPLRDADNITAFHGSLESTGRKSGRQIQW